jgi:hypothetical protein
MFVRLHLRRIDILLSNFETLDWEKQTGKRIRNSFYVDSGPACPKNNFIPDPKTQNAAIICRIVRIRIGLFADSDPVITIQFRGAIFSLSKLQDKLDGKKLT